jgi:Mor family transcriptional regulator
MGRTTEKKLPQFVADLTAHGVKTLTEKHGMSKADALSAMERIACDLCNQYCRTTFYVPLYAEPALAMRDAEIETEVALDGPGGTKKFSPARVAQLARKHKLTDTQIYNILKARRKLKAGLQQSTAAIPA